MASAGSLPPSLSGGLPSSTGLRLPMPLVMLGYNFLPIVFLSYGFWDQYSDYLQSQSWERYRTATTEEYDFIIVGAGSAGSVLTNRLSAHPDYQVLLLENGGNPNPMQSVPGYFLSSFHLPVVDYDFFTVPQKTACLGLKDQRSYWPRGRGLGGSSNLNAMIYQRGSPHDFDRWAELSGSSEWKFENILRNFKNIEDYHGPVFNEKWHSKDEGGVYVSPSNDLHLTKEFMEAAKEMGYLLQDVNGRQEATFSRLDVTIKDGRRYGAYPAFLKPILDRKNLQIRRYSRVVKIHFDKDRRAYGLSYIRHGVNHFVRAKREIILSAGAIDSPKLLMLSGIGPKKHLESHGIKCLVNLPVGKNLQDHTMANFGPFMLNSTGKAFQLRRDVNLDTIRSYFGQHQGFLSTPLLVNSVGYIYSSVAKEQMRKRNITLSPDLQLLLWPIGPSNEFNIIETSSNLKKDYLKEYLKDLENKEGFFINIMLGKSRSRGEILLASFNYQDKPLLQPRYFTHPDDIRIMVDGLNFTVEMIETTQAFQKYGAQLLNRAIPGCEHLPIKTAEYYECYARHLTLTVYHPSGTCSMGKGAHDPYAVVDHQLRVLNTKGLRVVDGSVIPEIPNSNLNAPIYMLADKASEMILRYWEQHPLKNDRNINSNIIITK